MHRQLNDSCRCSLLSVDVNSVWLIVERDGGVSSDSFVLVFGFFSAVFRVYFILFQFNSARLVLSLGSRAWSANDILLFYLLLFIIVNCNPISILDPGTHRQQSRRVFLLARTQNRNLSFLSLSPFWFSFSLFAFCIFFIVFGFVNQNKQWIVLECSGCCCSCSWFGWTFAIVLSKMPGYKGYTHARSPSYTRETILLFCCRIGRELDSSFFFVSFFYPNNRQNNGANWI